MAFVTTHSIAGNLRGSIGNLVFRQMLGKTVVSGSPRTPKKQSDKQRENRQRFKIASRWAKVQMNDPEKKAYYLGKAKKLKLPNAYTAAVCDYMRKAEIKAIDTRRYQGKQGDAILIKAAKKDFIIGPAEVIISTADGEVIEAGVAFKKGDGTMIYKTQRSLQTCAGINIKVNIKDFKANLTMAVCLQG
jgi:hypothetical protein